MKSFDDFLTEAKAQPANKKKTQTATPKKDTVGSSRVKCVQSVVDHIRKALMDYDITTRKYVWNKLTSSEGEHLMDQIVRYPKTSMSMSQFTKLVIDSKK